MPSEITITTDTLKLGQIAAISGDKSLAAKAQDVELGRMSVPGQKITIDRATVRSRLACSGIADNQTDLLGADKVTVRQVVKVIKSEAIVELAAKFLTENIKEQAIVKWEPTRMPAEVVLPNQSQNIELLPRLVSRGTNGQTTVEISVVADGVALEKRQLILNPKYNARRAVAVSDVSAGETLTQENVKIETVLADDPVSADWAPPYGFVAVRDILAGAEINRNNAKAPKPQVILERNQSVIIRIDKPGLVVTAMGKSMQQGRLGELIKVKNIDSQRVILAKVNEDGTVEPVF
jgi:flagella basal body P-ring formation protein FlgA